jgi:hypothetical protein
MNPGMVTIGIFFFCMERYDRSAFLRFKHPIDRASFGGNLQSVEFSARVHMTRAEIGTSVVLAREPFREWKGISRE